ncbi:Peptidase family M13 containing protein, partial [Aphelenchoides avenae]
MLLRMFIETPILAMLVTSVSDAQTPAGYQRASKLLLDAMNESVNPCDDFYEFACGRWVATNQLKPGEPERSIVTETKARVDQQVKGLLDECAYSNSKAINAVKSLYDMCMNKKRLAPRKSYEVVHHLVNFGYWPIIQPKWSASDFDLTQLLIHTAKASGSASLFRINAVANYADTTQALFTVAQGDPPTISLILGLPADLREKALGAYERLLKGTVGIIAKDAGSCRSANDIANDVKEIIEFERKLAEITEPDNPKADPPTERFTLMKFSDLSRLLPA